ncbi:MAG: hypothetical protein A2Y45_05890 [Tenericutes bacterium GWC2_34_14]|nr:MAG: hypothetical protein A2Y45_05890 [Tenericutes bacterium GWC2_34_14]OHE33606.1 MAG: hypothetical protein A2012_03920 [Tenericutes bacterium GWE2_34_108]OHE36891.1 MAG: hypothetical protein A2Y46_09720 [Tenericutes bacterium GWF1_35_14]OHE38029.1 MAG: hypothetical protein A2Y44_08945 [Tenericutes bacterium GWF2_35_184]OHE43020.1 MAG: hypothetical protein A3K26_09730 [Tenericutes bacterium RIFOXYA12_FULL_35_10]OHE43454.1 MAG: hypothetical protein A2221_06790 [Tenericutes bacterium RIFOXYA
MRRSNRILHFDHLDLLGFCLALALVSIEILFVFPVFVYVFYKLRKRFSILLFLIVLSLILLRWYIRDHQQIPNYLQAEVKVIQVMHEETYDVIEIKHHQNRYLIYVNPDRYHVGDVLFVRGEVRLYPKQTAPYGFDQKNYYLSKGILGKILSDDITWVRRDFHLMSLRQDLIDHFKKDEIHPLFFTIIFGITPEKEDKDLFKDLNLYHLLSVSGFHLFLLVWVIKKIGYHMDLSIGIQDAITFLIYLSMLYLHRFDLGITRLFLMFILTYGNRYFDLRRSKLELIHITLFIMLVFHIEWMNTLSMLMIYIILVSIELLEPIYRDLSGISKRWVMGVIVMVVLIPFQSSISLLGLVLLPIIGIPFIFSVMVGAWMVMLLPGFHVYYDVIIGFFLELFRLLATKSLTLIYGRFDAWVVLIYYLLWIGILICHSKIKKMMIGIISMMFVVLIFLIRGQQTTITFLDVGQGDATIIKTPECRVVIDAFYGVKSYVMNQGIHEIDYLILTHSDLDHTLEASDLISSIKIKHLILSKYDDTYQPYGIKSIRVKSGDNLTCGNLTLQILSPLKRSEDANNASIVIKTKINNQTFLFAGDIEEEAEKDLVNFYGEQLKSDVLKIAHHGSNTSSTLDFLYHVNPDTLIISAGRDNHYGFPHQEVIERLMKLNATIYRTDHHGTIIYNPDKKKSKWELHLPF